MSDQPLYENTVKAGNSFPLIIALTALVLAVTSGVVNYRQNNLTNLESSLRDTRDQLQLAKNDITDIKVKTIKQLVDAEFAIKNQQHVQHENKGLREDLADARTRVNELESQIRNMDHKLVSTMASLKVARRKSGVKKTASKAVKKSGGKQPKGKKTAVPASLATLIASSDLDVYMQQIAPALQHDIGAVISKSGFKPQFPARPASMNLSRATTVFYYNAHYKPAAAQLVNTLSAMSNARVSLKKGASPYPGNKIIAHIIGN